MGPLATLTLFPPYSLDTSILAAVLVGVLVLALFTETLGWVFVGLVVPGYLASVFVIHREAGITIVVEAVLTYLVAHGLAHLMARSGAWSTFFGRERFFLIVIASVLVRAVGEVWLLPLFGRWLDHRFGTTFTVDRTLHSIGLVLVPLTANAFWKVGLRRGAFQVAVPVLITYAVLQFVLLPATNLSFGSLELSYEDVAQRFLNSPKAYIILLTTALLAARYNHLYGWDFNGILVPALIALTWLWPGKLIATFAEVIVLVLVARAVLAIPGIKTMNLEGARKTVIVFTLGFLLKFALGWALGGRLPGMKVTDLFGFGYLVPTLLAVKILQKQVISRVLLPTLNTSFAGVALGSAIGFILSVVEPQSLLPQAAALREEVPARLLRTPLGAMAFARVAARQDPDVEPAIPRRRGELREYEALWKELDGWLEGEGSEAGVREAAATLGLELRALPPSPPAPTRYVLFEPTAVGTRRGWDTVLLNPGAPGPILEVPHPVREAPSAEAAALLCARVACRAILVAGVDAGDVEVAQSLTSARYALDETPRLEIRADAAVTAGAPRLSVRSAALQPLWPGATVDATLPERAEEDAPPPAGVLRAHPRDLLSLVTSVAPEEAPPLEGGALLAALQAPRAPGAPLRAPATDAELLVLQQQIAAPLLDAGQPDAGAWTRVMAGLLDLEVRRVDGCACYLVSDPAPGASWIGAALLVRQGGAPLAFEVPATDRERGTLPFAVEAWRTSSARALVFADTRGVRDTEVAHPASHGVVRTAFQAFHQAVQQSLPPADGLVFHVRGYAGRPVVASDVILTLDTPVLDRGQRPPQLGKAFGPGGALEWLAPMVRDHDGAPELAGLFDVSPQQAFARTFGGAPLATLWLSETLRGAYVPPRRSEELMAVSGLSPLPLAPGAPEALLRVSELQAPRTAPSRRLMERFEAMSNAARRYVAQQGPGHLRVLAAQPGSARAYLSVRHDLPFVVVEARDGQQILRGLYFLQAYAPPGKDAQLNAGTPGLEQALEAALRRRAAVVIAGELPAGVGGSGGRR